MYTHPLVPPTNPGASSSGTIIDTGAHTVNDIRAGSARRKRQRVRVMVYTDVSDAQLRVRWADPVDGTLRTYSTTTITAAMARDFDILLQPGRTVVDIVTVTAPTTWQVAAEVVDDQGLAS